MKFKATTIIISALAAVPVAQAQFTVPGNGNLTVPGDAQIDGNLTVKKPDSLESNGTAPVASTPIGNNLNTGFTSTGNASLIYSYTTNGSGTQIQTVQTNGGVQITNQGNVTLNQTTTQVTNVAYDIETRALLVSDPSGYIVQVGDPAAWGAPGDVIPNGTTLPGTGVNVATVRDDTGQLLSVISDLTYDHDNDVATAPIPVGGPAGLDASGNPILTPAQIEAAVANGAPDSFVTVADPVTDTDSGNLTVGGTATISGMTTTNGISNSGEKITDLADGTDANDAVNRGQLDAEAATRADADTVLQANIDAEAATRADADTVLQANIDAEAATRADADTVLQANIDAEAATRSAEDTSIRNEFRLADTNIINAYTSKIQAEESARILADNQIRDEFRAADAGLRNEFQAADRKLRQDIDKNTRGIAMVAAMHNTTVDVGKIHAVDFNLSQFESSTGFSFGYAGRINENVQVHTAVASSDEFEEAVARIGVSIQW